jgi:hypothetical protein
MVISDIFPFFKNLFLIYQEYFFFHNSALSIKIYKLNNNVCQDIVRNVIVIITSHYNSKASNVFSTLFIVTKSGSSLLNGEIFSYPPFESESVTATFNDDGTLVDALRVFLCLQKKNIFNKMMNKCALTYTQLMVIEFFSFSSNSIFLSFRLSMSSVSAAAVLKTTKRYTRKINL